MNAQAVTLSGTVIEVPLNKLKKSPKNARKTAHSAAAIEALAASISAKTMLQAPVVEPELGDDGQPTGFYLVTIGEGRRLAMLLRGPAQGNPQVGAGPLRGQHRPRPARDQPRRKDITRSDMHPGDQFEAFRRLAAERGLSAEDIGAGSPRTSCASACGWAPSRPS